MQTQTPCQFLIWQKTVRSMKIRSLTRQELLIVAENIDTFIYLRKVHRPSKAAMMNRRQAAAQACGCGHCCRRENRRKFKKKVASEEAVFRQVLHQRSVSQTIKHHEDYIAWRSFLKQFIQRAQAAVRRVQPQKNCDAADEAHTAPVILRQIQRFIRSVHTIVRPTVSALQST